MNDSNPQSDEFIRLLTKNEAQVRQYLRALLPHVSDVDEVMQTTSLVAWRKFDELDDHNAFCQWACVVARYEAMKYRRTKARDRHVFDDELVQLIADEGLRELDDRKSQREALQECIEKLPADRRQILVTTYSSGKSTKELASSLNRTPESLYMLLSRIRRTLHDCIQKSLTAKYEDAQA